MNQERDPRLVELFAAARRPIPGEDFVARSLERIEKEEKHRIYRRNLWIVLWLVGSAFAIPALARFISQLAWVEWFAHFDGWNEASVIHSIVLATFIAMSGGVALLWRALRSDA